MKTPIYVFLFLIIALDLFSCKPIENKYRSFADDDEIATITTDDEKALLTALDTLNTKGGTIYIDTPVITITNSTLNILGTISGGIIGIRQSSGEYPRISFLGSNNIKGQSGLTIIGSNKFLEYLIIEHSLTNGVQVLGNNNIFDHVISRYNGGAGFYLVGNFNTLNYCYSYRNIDLSVYQFDGDGFRIAGESNNVMNYCFAWDNANNGFNYVRLSNSSDLSYVHSGSWNNGNIHVFTGKYDYDNGYPLDKRLITLQEVLKTDENFASNYYNKNFNIKNAKIGDISLGEWVAKMIPKLKGEGFTFGYINSTQSIDVKRNSFFNVAFNNKAGGFTDNYNHRYNAFVTDCVSFNNAINYKLPYYILSKWSNNWSWNSRYAENLNGNPSLLKPRNVNAAQRNFYSVRNQITNAVFANMFPDNVNFDKVISTLQQ